MHCIRVLLLSTALGIPLFGAPGVAAAQYQTDPIKSADGRLRGYDQQQNVVLEDSSTALTYLALIGLTAMAVGLMFKASRRTHLD